MTSVANMPSDMMIPCFMPASQHVNDSGNYECGGLQDLSAVSDDNLDFDLLAEYLLDDGASPPGATFDFRYVHAYQGVSFLLHAM